VLFVAPDWDAPARYRCVHAAEQLRADGEAAVVRRFDDPRLAAEIDLATHLVLFRLPWGERIARLVERARARGVPIVFDTDDLVLDPDLLESLTFLDRLPPAERDEYFDLVPRVRRTFDEADHVIVATPTLARHVSSLGKRVVVHPNLVPPRDQHRAAFLRIARRWAGQGPLIGYASGSHTHDEDLAAVTPALTRLLESRSEVSLLIGGFVNLNADLHRFADRITRLPYLDHEVYPFALARCRVVLSPTAVANVFADAKSPMKLLEAGLLDVPAIATPTAPYRDLLTSGWNGWLARSEEDWRVCLDEALAPERAAAVGRRARRTVLDRFTYAAQAGRLAELIAQMPFPAPREIRGPARWRPEASHLELPRNLASVRSLARRWRQRWSLLRHGNVGQDTLAAVRRDWWRSEAALLIEPSAFEAFLAGHPDRRITGWEPTGDARAATDGSYESVGNDPHLLRAGLELDAASCRFLVVRQRTESEEPTANAQLFFATPETSFAEAASVRFPVIADGTWRTYVLDLSNGPWPSDGTVCALRFDPLEGRGRVEIDAVALLPPVAELLGPASTALRAVYAQRYLRGRGAEFGALQNALPLPEKARAFFVDELTYAAARRRYPELDGQPLIHPSIVGTVQHLPLRSGCLDFAIANHLLEHAKDPICALREILRVVRPGGIVFASVPDVGNPLDRGRSVTSIDHLIADHERRSERAEQDLAHYREAITSAHPHMGSEDLERLIRARTEEKESIHFHTFDEESFRWLLGRAADEAEVEAFMRNPVGDWDEFIAVLRRRRSLERAER
jgi:SAM-dependent methyltransferase/glycosyltransferase involved in cell wall biosynthesis